MQYPTLDQPDVRVTIAERDMHLHYPLPTLLRRLTGIGSMVCAACGEPWRGLGCQTFRDARVTLITYAARKAQARPTLSSVRPAEDHYRWRVPVSRAEYRTSRRRAGGRHRAEVTV
ncbi:hypothetical protein [Glycomyces sp. NPDC021274]|uniref:hypothetical protein n=1 Tax=Glycomyces sp. NPDC021274 TaxID=3155120 RepID=UPI0033D803BC